MNRQTAIGLSLIFLSISLLWIIFFFRSDRADGDFTPDELAVLKSADSIMRVLTIENNQDLAILRANSTDLSDKALLSPDYTRLCSLMISTVTHPSQDGVGIAGPQVGLNRRVVAVQRFDKDGYPFEVYPNVKIVWASDSLAYGPEGCLSVPNRRGDVPRSQKIIIEYTDLSSSVENSTFSKNGDTNAASGTFALPTIRDTIIGFTAVIFQHEIDHLDGILYTDRLPQQD